MNNFSWERDDYDPNGKLILLYRQQRIIDEGVIKSGMRVLDVGGWGKLSRRLSQEGCDVTLLNLDYSLCCSLRSRYPSINLIYADIRRSGIPDASFDAVHCSETLEHILEERDLAISEIARIIRPGGVFVGTIPIPGVCHPKDDKSVSFIMPEEFKALVKEYFSNVSIEPTASIDRNNKPGSWYFVCYKER